MVYVSLTNRILFWVGGSVAERASELQAGQLQRAACSRLLGQLNPLICQWVISGTRLGKATDSTGYTETTHIIRTKRHQMDSSKQTVDVHASDAKAEVTTNKWNTQRTVTATSASEVKTHLQPQEMWAWLRFVQTIAEAVHTGSFNGRRFGACWDLSTPGITHRPTHAWKTL